jgi:diketogulonate reductase-like aldo/keto reductase
VHRDDLFLITKLDKPPANMTDPSEAASLAQDTLDSEFDAMGLDSVDLLLLKDSATCAVVQAQWAVLESALAAGRAKGLGEC